MRLFVGIAFQESILEALVLLQHALKGQVVSGRFPHRENMHLTLAFLGEVPTDRLPKLITALAEGAKESRPFSLQFGRIGAFGKASPFRVVWQGFAGDTRGLIGLQANVSQELEQAGFAVEKRPYRPHITLARDVEIRDASVITQGKLGGQIPIAEVTRFCLIESRQEKGKRIYTTLEEFRL